MTLIAPVAAALLAAVPLSSGLAPPEGADAGVAAPQAAETTPPASAGAPPETPLPGEEAPAEGEAPAPEEPGLQTVVRDGRTGRTAAKLDIPLRELPVSAQAVSAQRLAERGVDDLVRALGEVPGLHAFETYGGFTNVVIRGFSDFVLLTDGMRDDRHTIVTSAPSGNLADVERIEVLKGPASVLYGYGAVGGVVNVVRKQPLAESHAAVGLALGTPDVRRATLDLTGPLGTPALRYRLTAGLNTSTDFRGSTAGRNGGSLVLEWLPHEHHRLQVRGSLALDRYSLDAGIPTVNGALPVGVPRSRRFNTPQDFMDSRLLELQTLYSWRMAEEVELTHRLSLVRNDYEYFAAETLSVTQATQVSREYLYFFHHWFPVLSQLELSARAMLGVEHRLLVGYELGLNDSFTTRSTVSGTQAAPLELMGGVDPQGQVALPATGQSVRGQRVHALYAQDLMTLLPSLKLLVGARLDHFRRDLRSDVLDPETSEVIRRGDSTRRSAQALTWRAGAVFSPLPWATTYASLGTAFRPVTVVPADGRQLEPELGRQVEVGQRLELLSGRLELQGALFHLLKKNVTVALGRQQFAQAARQVARGVELDARLRLGALQLAGGYAYTQAHFERYEGRAGDFSGKVPRSVPDHTGTLWATWRLPEGLGFGLGGRVVGTSYADNANTVRLPAYGLLDAALFYERGPLTLSLHASNLLDSQDYLVSAINESQLYPGAPRQALAQVRIRL